MRLYCFWILYGTYPLAFSNIGTGKVGVGDEFVARETVCFSIWLHMCGFYRFSPWLCHRTGKACLWPVDFWLWFFTGSFPVGYGGSFIDCFSMPGCYAIPVRRFSEVLGKNAIVLSTGNYFPCLILSSFLFFLLVSWPEFRTRDRSVRCLYFGYSERGNLGSKKLLPEVELRLELTVLLALFLLAGIVVCTVLHPSIQVVPAIRTADWRQTLEVAGVMLFLIFGGFILWKWRKCKKWNSEYKSLNHGKYFECIVLDL